MDEALKELFSNVPVLLIVVGLLFIFFAVIAQVPYFNIPLDRPKCLGLGFIGAVAFIIGLSNSSLGSSLGKLLTGASPTSSTPSPVLVSSPEWYSRGENIFLKDINYNYTDANKGADFFKNHDFRGAAESFENAFGSIKKDPEVQIYLKNSKLLQRQEIPFLLASVVPVTDSQRSYAEEFLRGVADSQETCDIPIEILIANDENKVERAASIAQNLAVGEEEAVLGVIGHFSSSSTKSGLEFYGREKNFLPVISPTSTSDSLTSNITQHKVFFRTTPSDSKNGKKLAEYALKIPKVSRIGIFYNPDDPYSSSLRDAFASGIGQSKQIVDVPHLNEPGFDVENVVRQLNEKRVDTIALFPDTELVSRAIDILKESNDGKSAPTLLGGDALYSPELLSSGSPALGLVLAVAWFDSGSNYAKRAYEKWGGQISWVTAMSYDATQAFCRAIYNSYNDLRSKQTLQEQRDILLKNLENVSLGSNMTSGESLTFDKGEANRDSVLVQVTDKSKNPDIRTPKNVKYGFKVVR